MGAWCAVTQDGCTVICYAQYGTNNATQWIPQAGPGTYAIKDFRDNYSQVFPCRAGCPGCQSGGGGGGGIAPPPDPTNPQPPSDGEDPPPSEDPPNDGPITGPKPDPNPCGNSVPLGAPDAIPLNGSDQREALNWDREATRRDGFTHEQRFKQPNTIKIRFAPVVASMDADGPTLTTEGEIVMDGARMTARIPATTNGGVHFMPPELGVQHLYGNKGRSGTNGDAKMPRRVSQSFVNLWSDENDNGTTHSVILSSGVMAPGTTAPSNGWVLKREAPSGAGRLAIANTDANGAEDWTKPIRVGGYNLTTAAPTADGQVLVSQSGVAVWGAGAATKALNSANVAALTAFPVWHKVTITYEDFIDGSGNVSLETLPTGTVWHMAVARPTEAFAAAGDPAITMDVESALPIVFIRSMNVKVTNQQPEVPNEGDSRMWPPMDLTNEHTPVASLTIGGGGGVGDLTAGSVDIYLLLSKMA